MPRSTREWAQRKLDQSKNNIDWAGTHLCQVADTYEELHPEVSDPLRDCMTALAEVQLLIDHVRSMI